MYGKFEYTISGGHISASTAVACDICLYEKGTKSLVIIPQKSFDIKTYPSHSYSPVGIVVIPGSHNIYGDGSCAVMSLTDMSYSKPDTGNDNGYMTPGMCFGQHPVDLANNNDYNTVCYVGSNGIINNTIQGITDEMYDEKYSTLAYLPSDRFNTLQNPYDTDTYYHHNDNGYYAPSPYLTNESRNSVYYQTSSPSSSNNALSDFNGKKHTETLINLATAQSDWKTASTITNKYTPGYSPAACCCWRYHTNGTNQGDWYLPAMGELGYVMVKYNTIQNTLTLLQNSYKTSTIFGIDDFSRYWTSSNYESSNYYARSLEFPTGMVYFNNRSNGLYVRSFLRVK